MKISILYMGHSMVFVLLWTGQFAHYFLPHKKHKVIFGKTFIYFKAYTILLQCVINFFVPYIQNALKILTSKLVMDGTSTDMRFGVGQLNFKTLLTLMQINIMSNIISI